MTVTSVDIDNLKELKVYCIRNDCSMRDFINEAIEEKLRREGV